MYSAIDNPHNWVLPLVLEEQALRYGDHPLVAMVGEQSLSYRQLRDQAACVASQLADAGVGPGDHIAVMLPNGLDLLRIWAGIGRARAVAIMINPELTQSFLAHPLRDSRPKLLIVHADYLSRIESLAPIVGIERIMVAGCARRPLAEAYLAFDDWASFPPTDAPFPLASDLACVMYTSGTTGAPKGVLMPHAHCFLLGLGVVDNLGVTAEDHYYITLPLSHANGLFMQFGGTLIAGARATLRERFSASAWLDDVRGTGATLSHSLGVISAFVLAQPESRFDKDHRLRLLLSAPNFVEHERIWRDRFGIRDVLGGYGMTEVNIPLYGERGVSKPGTCGRPYARYFEVEIRDPDTDLPVPHAQVGEIMVRPKVANGFMRGYLNLPEKTVEAWRNFWFHTGDAGRMDADGYVTFVDRIKDCIRRRGENISATDIESAFEKLNGVSEIAAFPVPSGIDGGEDEIMLAIVMNPSASLTAETIVEHARAVIPRFARPRYLEFRTSLPKTPTEKVRKNELKALGITPSTIDLQELY
jgi:crotonobetaine/carnitine-CoA ligase